MKTATIRAPIYLPWIPFLWQLENSDVYVILDKTQFSRKETCATRNYIKHNDSKFRLSVPVQHTGIKNTRQRFSDALIDNSHNWTRKHFGAICHAYSKTPFFEKYKNQIKDIYNKYGKGKQSLINLDEELLRFLTKSFKINVEILRQSELDNNPNLHGEELLVDICRKVNADNYFCGGKEEVFINRKPFEKNSIKPIYRSKYFKHPIYNQQGKQFIEGISSIDLLFNCGAEKSREILLGSGKIS